MRHSQVRHSRRSLFVLLISLPVLVLALATLYYLGMAHLENEPRSFSGAIEWAAETLTSTGYGRDSDWQHPLMVGFVVITQFAGIFLLFLFFPLILVPFFEERFEGRLAKVLPKLKGYVIIYGWGPAVVSMANDLVRAKIPTLVIEERELTARRLHDHGVSVVYAQLEEDNIDLSKLANARAIIANSNDANNAVLTLIARQQGFHGPIVALVDTPSRRNPLLKAGATAAFTPLHVLAAAISAQASAKITPRVAGAQSLGGCLEFAELRIHRDSSLAGKTLTEADLRKNTGATIIGQWINGELVAQPSPDKPIAPGTILVAAGSEAAMKQLSKIARPITAEGPIVLIGSGLLREKIAELLALAGEEIQTIGAEEAEGVDLVGDILDPALLSRVDIKNAQSIILAVENDATTLFAATLIRDLTPEAVIIASVNRAENVGRIHQAGADFAMSISQVAGQLLTYNILGEQSVELQPQLKLIKKQISPRLAGQNPMTMRLREQTNCSLVAIERQNRVLTEFDNGFYFESGDVLYLCGNPKNLDKFQDISHLHEHN